ncbi:hypothetical protein INR49_006862, partial [Caranx melampygus]
PTRTRHNAVRCCSFAAITPHKPSLFFGASVEWTPVQAPVPTTGGCPIHAPLQRKPQARLLRHRPRSTQTFVRGETLTSARALCPLRGDVTPNCVINCTAVRAEKRPNGSWYSGSSGSVCPHTGGGAERVEHKSRVNVGGNQNKAATMATSDMEDDVYCHLSDEEMLHIAVERSLADLHCPPGSDQTTSHPQDVPPSQTIPRLRHHDLPKNLYYVPLPQTPPPEPPKFLNCANPPTALSQFLYKGFKSLIKPDNNGWIALHEAAYYGQLQCVRILVRAYPDSVNRCNAKNQTALFLAAEHGNFSCVDFLLKHGANPNIADKDQETPLFTASQSPNKAIVELLLRSGAQVNRCCSQGLTALHEACRHGHLELCKLLLEAGASADINAQAGDGASPLYEACKNGHVSAVEALLALKADANRSTKAGLLPLHMAVQNNHIRIMSLLIPVTSSVRVRHSGISPLHIAAERDRDNILQLLIESGFDVNAELSQERSMMYQDRRCTALYFSVYNGNLEAAEMLLEAGASPNLDVFNPLLIAVRLGWMDMATLLLRYGANVNAQISTQLSSFPSAILLTLECLPMLKLLLDHGCDARPCFNCPYGSKPHPAVTPSRHSTEDIQFLREEVPQHHIQFCEAVSSSSLYRVTGPIIAMMLDYVSHVRLCSRLLEVLDGRGDWMPIKFKAFPPHPLMQLCRLEIRRLLGVHRLKLLHTLPLPASLIRFLASSSIMAAAGVSHSGSAASALGFEDYSLYSNLTDDELLQLAIERSLTDTHCSNADATSDSSPHQPNRSLNPVARNTSQAGRSSRNPAANPRSHNPPVNSSSHNPPANSNSHNPPANSNSHNPAAAQTTAHYSSPNPPSEKPPDLKTFDGTVSRFMTGSGKRMVAYRRPDGNLVYMAPEPEEEEEPLFRAVRTGDASRVKALVMSPGTNLMLPSKPGWLAIHEAAWYGQETCLRVLLSAQPGMINKRTERGETALLVAVGKEHLRCVQVLLGQGADPEIPNYERETPLYKACERSSAALVAELLNHGVAVNTSCIQGWTALQEAVVRNNVEICEMLVKAGAKLNLTNMYGITPLFSAAQTGQVTTLRFLLKHGADINTQAADGATALYEAAKNGHEGVVKLLISQNADANKPGKTGLLPLHIAAQRGSDTIVSLLIPATSKARVRRTGISPLHMAAERNRDEVLESLIEAGFDVNAQLSEERSKLYEDRRSTPLYFSVINSNIDAVRMLLAAGANPNLDVFKPLMVAARQSCIETVTLLVEHGADINASIPTHPTTFPAVYMFSMKYLPMFKYLLDHGGRALSCFDCVYGSKPHPPIKTNRSESGNRGVTDTRLRRGVQFCEMISAPSICRWAGPIIDVLLDYVGHVTLCSRLVEHLDSYSDWSSIKDKAAPPRPLMQLCRLQILQQVQRRHVKKLLLPGSEFGGMSWKLQMLHSVTSPSSPSPPPREVMFTGNTVWPSAVPAVRSEHLFILMFSIICVLLITAFLIIITVAYKSVKRKQPGDKENRTNTGG